MGDDDPPPHRRLIDLLDIGKYDVALLVGTLIAIFLTQEMELSMVVLLLYIILGVWLISKPSDWIADGVIHLGIYWGISDYVLGIISSLTAILGELTIATISAYFILRGGQSFLVDFAVLTTLFSMIFNMIILGAIIIVKGGKEIKVPDPVIARELEIIDMVFAISSLIAMSWFIRVIHDSTSDQIIISREVAIFFPIIYLIYLTRIVRVTKKESMDEVIYREAGIKVKPKRPEMTLGQAILLIGLGALLTVIGGNLIVDSVQSLVENYRQELMLIGDPVIVVSMLVGFSSAIYDMIISLRYTSEGRVLISIGGLIGSVPALFMIVIGGLGIVFGLPVNGKTVLLLISMSVTMLYLRHAITDDKKLDSYEGMILVLLQIVALLFILHGA